MASATRAAVWVGDPLPSACEERISATDGPMDGPPTLAECVKFTPYQSTESYWKIRNIEYQSTYQGAPRSSLLDAA